MVGVPYINNAKFLWARIIWCILLLLAMGAMCLHLWYLFDQYLSFPIITKVSLGYSDLRFPKVTLCNTNVIHAAKFDTINGADELKALLREMDPSNIAPDMYNPNWDPFKSAVPPLDGGSPDSGPSDSGPSDMGPSDMGPSDEGSLDGGLPDTGPSDSGPSDEGSLDGGLTDTGSSDSAPSDGGSLDGGSPDTGPSDGGSLDGGLTDSGPSDSGPSEGGSLEGQLPSDNPISQLGPSPTNTSPGENKIGSNHSGAPTIITTATASPGGNQPEPNPTNTSPSGSQPALRPTVGTQTNGSPTNQLPPNTFTSPPKPDGPNPGPQNVSSNNSLVNGF